MYLLRHLNKGDTLLAIRLVWSFLPNSYFSSCDISTSGSDKGQIVERGNTNNFVCRSIEIVKDE